MPEKPERWQNEAMRLGGEALVEKIFEIADGQKQLVEMMDKFDDRHRDAEIAIQNLYKAIPGGDVEGHRRAHELMIEEINSRKRLTAALIEKGLSGILWGSIVGACLLIWRGLLEVIK